VNSTGIAEDMDFGPYPIGPVGKPTELSNPSPLLAMAYTKYPQVCKALMAFMMEADQFNNWLEAARGYLIHSLNLMMRAQYGTIRSGSCSVTSPSAHLRMPA
jgi:hypothetical protein